MKKDKLKDVTSMNFENMRDFVDKKCSKYKEFLYGEHSQTKVKSFKGHYSDSFQHESDNIYNLGPAPKSRYTALEIDALLEGKSLYNGQACAIADSEPLCPSNYFWNVFKYNFQ